VLIEAARAALELIPHVMQVQKPHLDAAIGYLEEASALLAKDDGGEE
jgi:hypothetical protein